MKNYYEILEVSQNASDEVIERSYKVLVKKYHPDLHPQGDKKTMEEKMMQINEAYEVLKDQDKKYELDQELAREKEREEQLRNQNRTSTYTNPPPNSAGPGKYTNTYQSNMNRQRYSGTDTDPYAKYSQEPNINKEPFTKEEIGRIKKEEKRRRMEMQNRAQYEAEQQYRNMGYNVKHTMTWLEKKRLFYIILGFIVFCIIIWFFPPTKKLLVNLYNGNGAIKLIGDIIGAFFKAIRDTFSQNTI